MATAKVQAGPLDHAATLSIILGILLAMLLAALDQTIVATALPTIGRALGDVEHLPWVVTSYLLTATAVTPLYGKLSDIHGRRVILLIAIGVFMVGSVLCALAPTMFILIAARGLQGMGGGGLISLAQTIIGDVVAPRERARYQGYIASVFATSSIAGPALGGFLSDYVHWSAIFWINVPLGFAAVWMTNSALKRLPRHDRPHKLDVPGALLMVVATVALMLALSWGGVRFPWGSVEVLGLLGLSILFWVGFGARLRTAREPLLPLAVLGDQVVATGTAAAFFVMGTFVGLTIYVPVYLQLVGGLTPAASGLALIPLSVATVTGATVGGRLMLHVKHYKRIPIVSATFACAATIGLALLPEGTPLWTIIVCLIVLGLGTGPVFPVSTVAIQNAVEIRHLGIATASANFFRSLGGAIGVAGMGAIILVQLAAHGGNALSLDALATAERSGALDLAYVFSWVFYTAAAAYLLGLLCIVAMEERPFRSTVGQAPPPAVAE
jgi:EmrB/QacA subfamily drug resistance transporter